MVVAMRRIDKEGGVSSNQLLARVASLEMSWVCAENQRQDVSQFSRCLKPGHTISDFTASTASRSKMSVDLVYANLTLYACYFFLTNARSI